jgi:hypothetical protein
MTSQLNSISVLCNFFESIDNNCILLLLSFFIVFIVLSSIVILTLNGQFFSCATVAVTERYYVNIIVLSLSNNVVTSTSCVEQNEKCRSINIQLRVTKKPTKQRHRKQTRPATIIRIAPSCADAHSFRPTSNGASDDVTILLSAYSTRVETSQTVLVVYDSYACFTLV